MPGWEGDISAATEWGQLPSAAQAYIRAIEELVGARVTMVSVGPDREQTILR